MRLRIPNIEITRHPAPNAAEDLCNLDYETTDDLVDVATRLLAQQHNLSDLHLVVSELSFLDSAALSGLLIMHHRASQARRRIAPRPPAALWIANLWGQARSNGSSSR